MKDQGDRTTGMFSATFPEEIQPTAAKFLGKDYLFVAIGTVGSAANSVRQTFLEVTEDMDKEAVLMDMLQPVKDSGERTVIFVQTRRMADFFATKLSGSDFPATSIHGDRLQRERETALHQFRTGQYPILVATNVAARGLDIKDVKHVINLDLPKETDEYVSI